MISSSQRLLPDNTQHSQQRDIHAHGGIRNHNRSKTVAADSRRSRAATGTGNYYFIPGLYVRQSSSTRSQKPATCLYAVEPSTLYPMCLRSIFCYPLTMPNLSKCFLLYVSSYHHPPPPPVLSCPYMFHPSFMSSVYHT